MKAVLKTSSIGGESTTALGVRTRSRASRGKCQQFPFGYPSCDMVATCWPKGRSWPCCIALVAERVEGEGEDPSGVSVLEVVI